MTPEVTYKNYSIERYDYQRRNSRGATLLIVEIALKEIRQVSAQYAQSNRGQIGTPKSVAATPPIDGGKVQAQPARASVLKSLVNGISK